MVSMRIREQNDILRILQERGRKFAHVLDETDYVDKVQQSVRQLNKVIYSPRRMLLENAGKMADVTKYSIDEITTVYFSDKTLVNFLLPEMGIMPFLTKNTKFNSLEGIFTFLNIKSTLNNMTRQMESTGDWHLFPVNAEGKQFLQLSQDYTLIQLEFLPFLDPEKETWELYEHEYQYMLESSWVLCNLYSAESLMSASALGVGKEMGELLNYWTRKKEALDTEFRESSIITYIQ